jgi:hypothetical protein
VSPNEEVFWFDVAVDEVLIVSVLQGGRHLLNVAQDYGQRKGNSFVMPFAHSAIGCIVHHQIGGFSFDPEVEDAHNVWMDQASDGTSLPAKGVGILAGQLRMEQLNGGLSPQVHMLAQVDLSEAALSEQADETIVA